MFDLEKEDLKIIDALSDYIFQVARELSLEKIFKKDKLKDFKEKHLGYQFNIRKRCKGEAYTFSGKNEVDVALNLFFADEKACREIAEFLYVEDEDSYLVKSMDIGIALGECVLPNKAICPSSVFEVTMKVRPYRDIDLDEEGEEMKGEEEFDFPHSIHPVTKLPFDIIKIAVFPPKAKEV